jgi:hypothetical protein
VHIWDIRPLIESLDVPGYTYDKARVQMPVFTISSHGCLRISRWTGPLRERQTLRRCDF